MKNNLKIFEKIKSDPWRVRRAFNLAVFAVACFFVSYSLNINMLLALFLFSCSVYVLVLYSRLRFKTYRLLHLAFLFAIFFVCAYMIADKRLGFYMVPFAVFPMLATLLFNDLFVSLLVSVAYALTVGFVFADSLFVGAIFLVSGIFSNILVFDARKRNTIIASGIIIGAVQVISLFLAERMRVSNSYEYLLFFFNGIGSSMIVLGVMPVFEFLFGTITNISLLELADFRHLILNRMILEAPGTYHHSLIVGNLSEAAAQAIGANSLLSRVGAYYHDIGKLQKPEYFTENEAIKGNKHEDLSPSMSRLIIINHVKEGVEIAKSYRLNPRIIDFIQQHHGNSLVYYFYRRALEKSEEDQDVKEEVFRYPGPKPKTKETAIVLLADSAEAATRTLKEPNAAKVEETVRKIINNKFIDGQLDECDLTLRDLEKIASIFIRILNAIYHTRVTYPDGEKENNHNKPPKKTGR